MARDHTKLQLGTLDKSSSRVTNMKPKKDPTRNRWYFRNKAQASMNTRDFIDDYKRAKTHLMAAKEQQREVIRKSIDIWNEHRENSLKLAAER